MPARTALVLMLLTSGCSRVLDSVFNEPPLRRYAQVLVGTSHAALTLDVCRMYENSRSGWCRLAGSTAELEGFTRGLALREEPPQVVLEGSSCLSDPEFGTRVDGSLAPRPGVRRFVTAGPLPANTDNVRLVSVWVAASHLCLEFTYPYG